MKKIIKKIFSFILNLFNIDVSKINYSDNNKTPTLYKKKHFMSECETYFYKILIELEPNYKVIPQLNLASIIKKVNNTHYYTDLYRNIDFAIFDRDLKTILLLIEIDDKTHQIYYRKDRDLKIDKICNDVDIKLIRFYTNYPNKKEYILNRIYKILNEKGTNKN